MSFLHGIQVKEIDKGTRPIQVVKSSVIGLIGTAPKGPVNVPTLIAGSRSEAMKIFGASDGFCTIPDALDAIFDQTGTAVVVVNVLPQVSNTAEPYTFTTEEITLTASRIIPNSVKVKSKDGSTIFSVGMDYRISGNEIVRIEGGEITTGAEVLVDYRYTNPEDFSTSALQGTINETTGEYEGAFAFLGAESVIHYAPRILIAPGFVGEMNENGPEPAGLSLLNDLISVAERLRAVVIADGPNENDQQAGDFRKEFDSSRLYLVDPYVKVYNPKTEQEVVQPASSRVAGILSKSDYQRGFWYSPSNRTITGITGTARAVDFAMGDEQARANLLNEQHIGTIIHMDGYRLWGNRTCTTDTKWMYLSVRRTADMINDSLLRAHMWAVDNNINKNYLESVTDGVNDFLRHLQSIGAILGGKCWADPELNTPDQIQQGKVFFDFDFTPPYPAESITFRSQLVNNYLTEVI